MKDISHRRNVGLFAHVDTGKTTLTERLLEVGGAIRTVGQVDAGTAHTDQLDIEKRRGISVKSTTATTTWRDTAIHLIDTPGHTDFAFEVERALWALDGAVLLLSAVDGVEPYAEQLFEALRERNVPTLLFINKADRENADVKRALFDARQKLSPRVIDYFDAEQMHERLAEGDEQALSDFVEGRLYSRSDMLSSIRQMAQRGEIYPALYGSALRNEGIEALLDAIVDCLPPPAGDPKGAASGIVFAIDESPSLGRCAHVRMISGTISNRDGIDVLSAERFDGRRIPRPNKVTQIRDIPLEGRGIDLGRLSAGEIGAVYGLGDARVGEILGDIGQIPHSVSPGKFNAPLLMVRITPDDPQRKNDLRQALHRLSAEDPLLFAEELSGEMHVRVMGVIQTEVLKEWLKTRFSLDVTIGPPNVIYRETIRESAVGFYAYTMPKPCWAVIKFQIDPAPRGSGVQFDSVVPSREIMPRYQHQVRDAIGLATRQGMLGWQVDDVKITLIGGEHHLIHTHPLDFIVCTPIAFMDGLKRGGSTLLEPMVLARLAAPEELAGRILSEIVSMRGMMLTSDARDGLIRVEARFPVSTSVDFPTRFAQITSGRGTLSLKHDGYEATDEVHTCPRRSVHPLDTSKYILASRSALDGNIFDLE